MKGLTVFNVLFVVLFLDDPDNHENEDKNDGQAQ